MKGLPCNLHACIMVTQRILTSLQWWWLQDYINKLTHLLLAAEEGRNGAALAQIRELVEAQRWAVQAYGKNDMSNLMKLGLDVRREGSTRFRSGEAARSLMVRPQPCSWSLDCKSN
jgi:hypothetical protein